MFCNGARLSVNAPHARAQLNWTIGSWFYGVETGVHTLTLFSSLHARIDRHLHTTPLGNGPIALRHDTGTDTVSTPRS
jgi:hypothetical protein